LAVLAAFFVAIVAHGIGLEAASARVTTRVISTAGGSTAIALFSFFHDAVTALGGCDQRYSFVVREAGVLYRATSESCTDIANGALRERSDALSRGWVHDEPLTRVAGVARQGATH